MSTLLHDLKFGVRLLAKTPAFTVVAALSLAQKRSEEHTSELQSHA